MTPIHLLIAEDNATDAELLVRELRRNDFEVTWARVDTEEAFRTGLHAGIDLVLSDYEMPGFGGLRALEVVQESGRDVPFIIVSGTIGEETAVAAMKFGAADYLLKDRLSRLSVAVTHALTASRLRRERRAMEAANARAEAKYRTMFENSTEGLYQTTPDGCLLLANETLAAMAGYASAAEMIACAENVAEEFYADPADRERFKAQLLADGVVRGFETRMRRRDGSLCWISSNAHVSFDETRNCCYEGALQDITARKQAEEDRRASEERFRSTLDRLMEGCMILARDWRYLYVNEISAAHGRRTVAELLGAKMTEVYPGVEATAVFAAYRASMEDGRPRHTEIQRADDDGTSAWFELVIQPVPEGLFVLSLDITARKAAEEKMRDQLDELRRWHDMTLGREERIMALKTEVNALLRAAGAAPRYQGEEA